MKIKPYGTPQAFTLCARKLSGFVRASFHALWGQAFALCAQAFRLCARKLSGFARVSFHALCAQAFTIFSLFCC